MTQVINTKQDSIRRLLGLLRAPTVFLFPHKWQGRQGQMKIVKILSGKTSEPETTPTPKADPEAIENRAIVDALKESQAFISFHPDGTIITANKGFLNAMGYDLSEVEGRHHSMFCEQAYSSTAEYQEFWNSLARGNFHADQFKRIAKGGREVHIQATYNPIKDERGKVIKVVKFASDITERVANVEALAAALQRMAEGDLTVRINKPFGKDLERLRSDFNGAISAVEQAISGARDGAHGTSKGIHEISQAAEDLARRVEQQAARLSQSSTELGEITKTVKDTAQNAANTQKIVKASNEDAEASSVVVKQAVVAMQSIEESSTQISQILSVIDEIAFQTNLLALNAGVEAARAGDAGRGFAVVASEVRALAQRSSDAAKQIKDLIDISNDRVNEGVDRVAQTNTALEKIITGISEIARQTSEIVTAAESQADGIHNVANLVDEIDTMTQQNAAMVEETTAASRALAQESADLTDLVNRFRVGPSHMPGQSYAPTASVA